MSVLECAEIEFTPGSNSAGLIADHFLVHHRGAVPELFALKKTDSFDHYVKLILQAAKIERTLPTALHKKCLAFLAILDT